MNLKLGNTGFYLLSRIVVCLCVMLFLVGRLAIGSYGNRSGWYTGNYSVAVLIACGSFIFMFFAFWVAATENKIIGEINISDERISILYNSKKNETIELKQKDITDINILLDNDKEKLVYKRFYFNSAENNWLIIHTCDSTKYKIEILIESLREEEDIITLLNSFETKGIQVSIGTKRKSLLHTIWCYFA